MKGNAARLCATAVAVAAVVGGVTFAAPAEAATSGLCNLSGTENIFGRQIWCKWSTGGKYVSITLSNASANFAAPSTGLSRLPRHTICSPAQ